MPRNHRNSRQDRVIRQYFESFLLLVRNPQVPVEFEHIMDYVQLLQQELEESRRSQRSLERELATLRSAREGLPQVWALELSRTELRRRVAAARHLLREMSYFLPRVLVDVPLFRYVFHVFLSFLYETWFIEEGIVEAEVCSLGRWRF
jgi:FtsZ-binding cell division protein ZapB